MVICLERGADLHTAQLMPLPLTVSCFSKNQIVFTFLVPAHLGIPGKSAYEVTTLWRYTNLFIIIITKQVCVCVWNQLEHIQTSAHCSRQITTPTSHPSLVYRLPLPGAQPIVSNHSRHILAHCKV